MGPSRWIRWTAGGAVLFLVVAAGLALGQRLLPLSRAQRALGRGDPGTAVEILKPLLPGVSASREERTRTLLAQAYLAKGALESAEQEYRALRERFPKNVDAALGLGVLNAFWDRRSFAEAYLAEAQGLSPQDIRSYLLLARVQRMGADHAKTARTLQTGLEKFPGDPRLLEMQADLDFDRGRYAAALSRYSPLAKQFPRDRNLRIQIALSHLFSGSHRLAAELLAELKTNETTDYPLDLAIARIQLAQGNRSEARQRFAALYQQDNTRVDAGFSLARVLAEQGHPREAQATLDDVAQRVVPLSSEFFQKIPSMSLDDLERASLLRYAALRQNVGLAVVRGQAAVLEGKFLEAEQSFRRALNLEGDSYGALTGMMDLARRRGQPEERLRWADRLVAAYTDHPAALLARAEVRMDLGRLPDAIIDARLAADAYPQLARAQALLARAWLLTRRTDPALAAAERAVGLNPGDPMAHLSMGLVQARRGNARRAETSFLRALDLDPRWAVARAAFADWLDSQGRKTEARHQRAEAARLEPFVHGRAP